MTGQTGATVRVWVKAEIGPRHVVAQVLDPLANPVSEEFVIGESHDLYEIARRFGVSLDAFDFEGEAADIVESAAPPDEA